MRTIKLMLVLCGLVMTAFAQEKGIKFRDFDNWDAALEASRKENKPIFVDFFTTWCGPCKLLEKKVYPDSVVGKYFNSNFISVKVQMDTTKNDNEQVKKWYPEITVLSKKFNINAYPTLLFISPKGEIRNVYAGFIESKDLIKMAEASLKPGVKYYPAGAQYYTMIEKYHNGAKNGPELVKALYKFLEGDKDVVGVKSMYFVGYERVKDTLTETALQYLRTQPLASLYTKEILTIIGTVAIGSKDPLFKLFYPNGTKVDNIVGKKNFARLVVDRAIRKEQFRRIIESKAVRYKNDFNWDSLYNVVKLIYNQDYAQRAIDAAKTAVSFQTHDWEKGTHIPEYITGFINMVEKYGANTVLIFEEGINWPNFEILKGSSIDKIQILTIENFCMSHLVYNSSNQTELLSGVRMMEEAVQWAKSNNSEWFVDWSNTYAWLLYKTGDKKKAIEIAKEGFDFANRTNDTALKEYAHKNQQSIELMRAGEVIWKTTDKN